MNNIVWLNGIKYCFGESGCCVIGGINRNLNYVKIEDNINANGKLIPVIDINVLIKNNRLKTLEIGNNVEYICRSAFVHCNKMTTVILPKSLKRIYDNAFRNNVLENLTIQNVNINYVGKNVFLSDKFKYLILKGDTSEICIDCRKKQHYFDFIFSGRDKIIENYNINTLIEDIVNKCSYNETNNTYNIDEIYDTLEYLH